MPNSAACWWFFFYADFHIMKVLSHKFLFQALGHKAFGVKHAGVPRLHICPSLAFGLSSLMSQ